jgi:hypothetical protein
MQLVYRLTGADPPSEGKIAAARSVDKQNSQALKFLQGSIVSLFQHTFSTATSRRLLPKQSEGDVEPISAVV